jgi:hypothetical protein
MLAGQSFTTPNFQETMWKQSSEIRLHGEHIGVVDVYYLVEKLPGDEGPFPRDERSLLDTIAKFLGEIIGRQWAEGERVRYAAQLQALAETSLAMNTVSCRKP